MAAPEISSDLPETADAPSLSALRIVALVGAVLAAALVYVVFVEVGWIVGLLSLGLAPGLPLAMVIGYDKVASRA